MSEPSPEPVDVSQLAQQHPGEIAERVSRMDDEQAIELLGQIEETEKVAEALGAMDPEDGARLFVELGREKQTDILAEMAPDDAVDLLEELPDEMVRAVLSDLNREDSAELTALMAYPPDTAGGMMSPDVVAVPADLTVQQTIELLRRQAEEAETVYYAYVVDRQRRLQGVLALRDLVLANPGTPIREVTRRDVAALPAEMDSEEVARTFDKLNYLALPVVDGENRLLGIVTVDDVIDRMREQGTEDVLRLSGIPSGEEHPLEAPPTSIRKRLPWMMANILFNLVAVIGVAVFEESIATIAFLAVLMPIISDMGGNVATQAMAVAIRGMATGQVVWKQLPLVLRKELLVGIGIGAVLGLELSLITYLWRGNIYLGLIAMASLWLNTIIAAIVGSFFPFLMKRLGFDPAMMSGSIVTTITDLTGFFLFLGMATLYLHQLT